MNRKEKGKELEKRNKQFAVQIIKLASELPNTEAGKIVKYQLVKEGTPCDFYVIIRNFQEIKLNYKNF